MQYPLLMFSRLFLILIFSSLGIAILYFLLRFNKTIKFKQALKAILFYEILAIIINSIYPYSEAPTFNRELLDFLILCVILFTIFYLSVKTFLQINWKRSLPVFLVMIIVFPYVGQLLSVSTIMVQNRLPIFSQEQSKFYRQWFQDINQYGSSQYPLSLKILDRIQGGVFSWTSGWLDWVRFYNIFIFP